MLEKTKGTIKKQSRDTGSIGQTGHRRKTKKDKKITTQKITDELQGPYQKTRGEPRYTGVSKFFIIGGTS